jgi:hypothetical protein
MGCDIHCYIEHKVNDVWIPAEDPLDHRTYYSIIGRNYDLFGFLAGVRNERLDSLPALGLPDDISEGLHEYYQKEWDEDAHSESFIYLNKLKKHILEFTLIPEREGGRVLSGLIEIHTLFSQSNEGKHSPRNSRMVFWFDN